jgi:hypothetical protein
LIGQAVSGQVAGEEDEIVLGADLAEDSHEMFPERLACVNIACRRDSESGRHGEGDTRAERSANGYCG